MDFKYKPEYDNIKLIDILMASCAALPYFPAY